MKLHVDKKKRGAIRKYLSILLVVCIVLSNGSTYVAASAGGEDGHQHVDGCYGRLAVCELAEHGDDCYQERLVCGQDGSDGHAHDGNCYGEVSMAGCGMEEHNEGCYKKVLACGYGDGTYDVAAFSETEGVQEAVDSEENGSDGATVEDMPQATDGQEPAEAGDGDGAGDMDEPEADVPSGGSVATEPEETGTPEESAGPVQPEETGTPEESAGPVQPEETGAPEESAGPAQPEETGTPEENAEPVQPEETGAPEESAGPAQPETTEKPEDIADSEQTASPAPDESGEASEPSTENPEEQPIAFDKDEWKLICDEVHEHAEACYQRLLCGLKGHRHIEECYDEEQNLICGMDEHEHSDICLLALEDQQKIKELNELIAALPSQEEIAEKIGIYEGSEEAGGTEGTPGEEAYAAYMTALMAQVQEAYEAYLALDEELREYVEGAEYLLALSGMFSGMTLEEPVWEPMGPDEAYVNEIKITGIKTGSAPFDKTEGQGNDTTADDKIVRTFDTVTYNFTANMISWNASESYSRARVKLEFVLPLTEKEAVFDQTAMAWMDQTEGYKPVLTTEMRTINGTERKCQVLTCYKWLLPSTGNQSVVPGDFGENVTINVLAMKNNEEFAPIISAAMEGGAWDGTCEKEGHTIDGQPAVEKKTVTAEPVKVTAAPKYNIHIEESASYKDDFQFQGDEAWMAQYGNVAANTDIVEPVPGRIMKLGITLQLYNDNEAKGLKGIELPTGDITFDLEVSSRYTINTPASGTAYNPKDVIDTSNEYRPLLWSYGQNWWRTYGEQNTDGRVLYDSLACSPHAPYSAWYSDNDDTNCCYRSGTWNAVQERETGTIHITVSGYEINPDQMPIINGDKSSGSYGKNVGCFSSGAIWIVQPFNTITAGTEHGKEPYYDVVNTYGQGAFATTVKDVDLRATTLSGATVEQGVSGFVQMVTDDDDKTRTLELTLPGILQNRVRYASATNPKSEGSGVRDNRDGSDYAAVGADLYLMGGFSYNAKREEDNQLYLGTNLTKFYGSAIELDDTDWFTDFSGGASLNGEWQGDGVKQNIRIRYATKPDGKDWANDKELLTTYEENLVFYESLDDIPDGHICLGILFTFIGPGAPVDASDPYYICFHKAKVRGDADLTGKTFMLASTSRVWTKGMYEHDKHNPENIPDWTEESTCLSSFPAHDWHYKSANIEGSTEYIKETYKPDGSGICGTHNSDWSHWGDTLLVIGYKTKVSKYLTQKDNNNQDKKTFNLDADQRVVDFRLEPGTYYDQPGTFKNTTTVTIVDTLPKYLTYRAGSAYFGGAYEQTSVNGGTQGSIIEDTSPDAKFPIPALKEPDVVNNADGTQTLTWKLQDVEIGTPMAPIYYSADIGAKGNPDEDVPTGTTNLQNQVYIAAPGDLRDPLTTGEKHSEVGIAVTRGSASSFGKYTKQKVVDEDGQIDYVVYYNNNAETGTSLTIMDTMPMNGENGSHFTGTYTFTEWKLDPAKCDVEKIKIYYTFDTKYKNKTTKDVKREEIVTWREAAINADGTITIPTEADGATKEQPYPVAWAVVGTLDSGQSVNIDLKLQLDPGASDADKKENNYFVNLLSSGDTTTTTETPTVRRTLEGLTWMDYNRDGIQDDPNTEVRISGIKVELLRLREGVSPEHENSYENVCYPNTDNPISVETGKQISVRAESADKAVDYETGRYKFTDLPAGIYAVRFTDGSGATKITDLSATSTDSGTDDTRDSDTFASRDETGKLVKTLILNLEMPKAENMSVSLFESPFHDSGFYPETKMTLQKVGESGEALVGAIFTIQDDSGKTLSFIYDEERGYTLYDEEGEESRKGKCYIALASNPYYVIGINGTADGSLPILQNRTGNANQLFEVRQDGELYSFRNMASGKWLDLDGGNLRDGAKVHVWSNTEPNENQKWYVTDWDAGSRISTSTGQKDVWCLDLNAATAQENQKIHLWSYNETPAQKWVLIPVGITADTQTDLNVDSAGGVTINNLKPGNYTIKELKSPTGHSLLNRPVAFTVQGDGHIEVVDSTMASVDSADNTVLRIKNVKLYALPSTGGSGTGTYAAAGTLLMLCSLLYAFCGRKKKVV
ncbi:SpaA isopeptide-forming pilin-related protein [uncultured Acetatifactor sp.]|uniref:SpaA isopeptide-forming pilin-related protein n=1 Tax=uncultured Acetatifactor sp. TaxID=1671927 RepID=UPI002617DBFA|nr:SpaA isopeptide-forming pilin-related protein [uncultured Acetatifactor sp.]